MKGKFITFEGSEGCGKSTQSKMLCEFLKRKGYKVVFLREPGSTRISEKIRSILLDLRNESMSPKAETLLYMVCRAQIVDEKIKPALKAGKIVICDRYLDSTLAYQGYGLGMDIKLIKEIGRFATCGIKPDLTILLDVAVKKGLSYRIRSGDRIEQRPFDYHQRVRRGYFKLAAAYPQRIKVVKVQPEKSRTQDKIRKIIFRFLKKK
ncbi:dTMP kinase [bacterium]|nr:MAG: dTMP kinase [bacterium]